MALPTPTTVKVKLATASVSTPALAKETGLSATDIRILPNMRQKDFKQELQVAQKKTSIRDYFQTM